jgi:L-2-hydroxyglutarate oxidase LhgO
VADAAVTVVGAGVVGLAVAAELATRHSPLYVLERYPKYGQETSSRNSEVIHAGIYYQEDSLKARLCVEGKELLYELCDRHGIPARRITKVISARDASELPVLEGIFARGTANGAQLQMMSGSEVRNLEPHIVTAGGIFSPTTGIVSAHHLMDYFYTAARNGGAEVQTRCRVVALERRQADYLVTIEEGGQLSSFSSERVVNAAGLEADTIASLAGIDVGEAGYQLHYCKGCYFSLPPNFASSVTRLVYPVPNKDSLGVHALLDLGGRLKFGPDVEYLKSRTLDYTVSEEKRHAFAESVRRILPHVKDEDLTPDMSGIRSKLQAPGEPPRDFVIVEESDRGLPGLVNLIGIESPGLTAAPAIARYVANLLS